MKKILSFILAGLLILSLAVPCFAEGGEFDYAAALGDLEGYSFDKFDKQWKYYRAYTKSYSDAKVIIGMHAIGEKGGSALYDVSLYVKILDLDGNILYEVKSIDLLLGEALYSYKNLYVAEDASFAFLGEDGQLLIEALAACDPEDASVRLGWGTSQLSFDLDPDMLTDSLIEFCQAYLENDLWAYCNNKAAFETLEKVYSLTLNGEPIRRGDAA